MSSRLPDKETICHVEIDLVIDTRDELVSGVEKTRKEGIESINAEKSIWGFG